MIFKHAVYVSFCLLLKYSVSSNFSTQKNAHRLMSYFYNVLQSILIFLYVYYTAKLNSCPPFSENVCGSVLWLYLKLAPVGVTYGECSPQSSVADSWSECPSLFEFACSERMLPLLLKETDPIAVVNRFHIGISGRPNSTTGLHRCRHCHMLLSLRMWIWIGKLRAIRHRHFSPVAFAWRENEVTFPRYYWSDCQDPTPLKTLTKLTRTRKTIMGMMI